MEILLVIALAAMVTAWAIWNFDGMLSAFKVKRPEGILREAVGEARFLAVKYNTFTRVSFDEKEKQLLVIREDNPEPLSYSLADFDIKIQFQPQTVGRGLVLQAEKPHDDIFIIPVFGPDRTCTPFVAVFTSGIEVSTYRFDPFSQDILEEEHKNN